MKCTTGEGKRKGMDKKNGKRKRMGVEKEI
jgi:hypothetical protein